MEERKYILEKGTAADAAEVMANITGARRACADCDWDDEYPSLEVVNEDIACGGLYVLRGEDGRIEASFAVEPPDGEDAEEMAACGVKWTPTARPMTLSRLCIRGDVQRCGMGRRMVEMAFELGRNLGYTGARFLASETNNVANKLYRSLGCRELGPAYVFDWQFIAYEFMFN